jgi:signal transduction histidine kinase
MRVELRNPSTRSLLKAALMVLLVCGTIYLTIWFHYMQKTEVIFESIFFIPIILGCLWYNRAGILLASFFAVLIIILSFVSPAETPVWQNTVEGFTYIMTAMVVSELSARRKALIASLEEKVEERTVDLKASNEELNDFASTVSHDLVGPLATLHGYTEIAKEAASCDNSALMMESLDTIDMLSMRMIRTVEDLLEHARSKKHNGLQSITDTAEAAREVIADLRGLLHGRDIEVVINAGLPEVQVEPAKLKQVLANLIGNSIKYAVPGKPLCIEIGGYGEDELVTLFVRDNGLGIDPQEQDMVFEEFARASTDEQVPGFGLGLAIVKRAVKGWGGQVWLESTPGGGATFYFTVTAIGS